MVSTFDWCSLACEAKDILQSTHGNVLNALEDVTNADFADLVDNYLACVVFGQDDTVCFQSKGFEVLTGHDRIKLHRKSAWLQSDREWLDCAVNGVQVQRVHDLHGSVLSESTTSTAPAKCNPIVTVMISCKSNGDPFFCLRHVFPIQQNASSYFIHVLTPVEAAIPGLLWPRSGDVTELAISTDLLATVLGSIHSVADKWSPGTDVSTTLVSVMSKACEALELLLVDALEGDHFVPRVGSDAVVVFERDVCWTEIYKNVESDLKAAWVACDQESYMIDKSGRSVTLACAIADPNGADCPLVYVSPGFETLTGYPHSFAQGRNCRFLQPNDRSRNIAFNGPELARMREFCTQKREGHIFNLLLNEQFKTGEPFWNLLFMKHLSLGPDRHYIFALQTNIEVKQEIMDVMVPQKWTLQGLSLLAKLRDILREHEQEFCPSERSFVNLANDITARWIMEFGRKFDCFWEGGHYCPMVGHGATAEFAGKWPEMAEICLKSVLELNKIQGQVRRKGQTLATCDRRMANPDQVVCAVADPGSLDCPLVFISQSFEEMTGYDKSFALGRNCRFLQPNNAGFNRKINGSECGRMRDFCTEIERHPVGKTILNLLLNERRTGERFWNLLHMTHVETNGKRYILAVQTNLDLPIPSLIRVNKVSHLDEDNLEGFADKLGGFLDRLREHVRRKTKEEEVGKCAEFVFDRILKFMKSTSEDYEGDLCIPRLGLENVELFKKQVAWSGICRALLGYECPEVMDVGGVFYSVADLDGPDQPLVYVSSNFRTLAGYNTEYALGRNGRFQQVKIQYWNDILNDDENERLHQFVDGRLSEQSNQDQGEKRPSGLLDDKAAEVSGFGLRPTEACGEGPAQLISVVVHSDRDCVPFWCVDVSQCVQVGGRRYLVTAHWKIEPDRDPDVARCLGEVLAMDRDALQELKRLRNVISRRFFTDGPVTLPQSRARALECLEIWTRRFPQHLQLPLCASRGVASPCVAVEISSSDHPELVTDRLASLLRGGVRHFHFGFPQGIASKDHKLGEMEARLFDIRLATVFQWLRQNLYMNLALNIMCSIRMPPHLLSAFSEFQKTLRACNLSFAFWLLDVTGEEVSNVIKCWKTMSAAKAAGDVKEIGLYGVSPRILQAVQNEKGAKMSLVAAEMYPGKKDTFPTKIWNDLRSSGVKLLAINPFGPNGELLENPMVLDTAQQLSVDPQVVVLKKLYRDGWLSVVPIGQFPWDINDSDDEEPMFERCISGETNDSNLEVPLPKYPDFHRKLARQFALTDGHVRDIWTDQSQESPTQAVSTRRKSRDSTLEGITASTFARRLSRGHIEGDTTVVSSSFCRSVSKMNSQIENQEADEAGLPQLQSPLSSASPRRRSLGACLPSCSEDSQTMSPRGRRNSSSGVVQAGALARRMSGGQLIAEDLPLPPETKLRRRSFSGVQQTSESTPRRRSFAGAQGKSNDKSDVPLESFMPHPSSESNDKLDAALGRIVPHSPTGSAINGTKTRALAPLQRSKTREMESSSNPQPPSGEKPSHIRRRSFTRPL